MTQEHRAVPGQVVGALALLVVGLALLGAGGFVQFDDATGFGSDQWNLALGGLAAVVTVAAIGVAWANATARLWLGVVLGVLDVLLIWQTVANDGFRFVWHSDDAGLFLFEVVLGLIALVLIATGLQPSGRLVGGPKVGAGRWLVRVAAYLCGTAVLTYFAFFAGIDHYDSQHDCLNYDCDLGGLEGMVWSMVAIGLCALIAVTVEVTLWIRRRRMIGTSA
ncbi:hypothetical protein AB0P21_01010 [Kribbella sp. NPDC056861]|uniref:hypothetical protein n=1 Tax=Kribbella sp. NPDC056861 TaxID=3154857 RepID=UPI003417BAC4